MWIKRELGRDIRKKKYTGFTKYWLNWLNISYITLILRQLYNKNSFLKKYFMPMLWNHTKPILSGNNWTTFSNCRWFIAAILGVSSIDSTNQSDKQFGHALTFIANKTELFSLLVLGPGHQNRQKIEPVNAPVLNLIFVLKQSTTNVFPKWSSTLWIINSLLNGFS